MDASNPLRCYTYVFVAPRCWQSLSRQQRFTYNYATHRLHGLTWYEGYARYCTECLNRDMVRFFKPSENIFYAIGQQKTEFLRRQFPGLLIMDYGALNNVVLKDLPPAPPHVTCNYRKHSREHCAVLKCYRLYLHYCSNRSDEIFTSSYYADDEGCCDTD